MCGRTAPRPDCYSTSKHFQREEKGYTRLQWTLYPRQMLKNNVLSRKIITNLICRDRLMIFRLNDASNDASLPPLPFSILFMQCVPPPSPFFHSIYAMHPQCICWFRKKNGLWILPLKRREHPGWPRLQLRRNQTKLARYLNLLKTVSALQVQE